MAAAVNVGAGKVFSGPVGVYVGSKAISVPEKEGYIVAGGKVLDARSTGSSVPAPA